MLHWFWVNTGCGWRTLFNIQSKGRLWQSWQGRLHKNRSWLVRKDNQTLHHFKSVLGDVIYTLTFNTFLHVISLFLFPRGNKIDIRSLIVHFRSMSMKAETENRKIASVFSSHHQKWLQTAVNSFSKGTVCRDQDHDTVSLLRDSSTIELYKVWKAWLLMRFILLGSSLPIFY